MKAGSAKGKVRDSYMDLILRFPLRPIGSEKELDQAIAVMDGLLDKSKLDPGEQDYLDVLSDLVEKFEENTQPIEPVADADMLRYLLDLRDLNQAALARQTGIAESTISAVLHGKRQLNRKHIGILAKFFRVDLEVFAFRDS